VEQRAYYGFWQKTVRCACQTVERSHSCSFKGGFEYRGKVVGCDNLMNVVLEEAVEYFGGRPTRSYGTILLRGNNIIYIIVL